MLSENVILKYFKDSFEELRKVTWPTKNQAIRLCVIVLAFTMISAVLIGLLDYLFSLGYKELLEIV